MSKYIRLTRQLTHAGAALAIERAVARAEEMGVPENISVVDAGGNLLAFARMDGAHVLAELASRTKARTAASLAQPSGSLPAQLGADLAFATGGQSVNLAGGLPIIVGGEVVGAIGVSSGMPEQDVMVAEAGRDAIQRVLHPPLAVNGEVPGESL